MLAQVEDELMELVGEDEPCPKVSDEAAKEDLAEERGSEEIFEGDNDDVDYSEEHFCDQSEDGADPLRGGLFWIAPHIGLAKHIWNAQKGLDWENADGKRVGESRFVGVSDNVKISCHIHEGCGGVVNCNSVWDLLNDHLGMFLHLVWHMQVPMSSKRLDTTSLRFKE